MPDYAGQSLAHPNNHLIITKPCLCHTAIMIYHYLDSTSMLKGLLEWIARFTRTRQSLSFTTNTGERLAYATVLNSHTDISLCRRLLVCLKFSLNTLFGHQS